MVERTDRLYGDGLAELLDRLTRVMRQLEFDGGLNPVHWEALRYLRRANHLSRTPGALAQFLGTTRGTVSQTLNCLESKGLVERVRCSNDRRVTFLELTERGAAFLETDPLQRVSDVIADMHDGVGHALVDGLNRLIGGLSEQEACKEFGICHRCCRFETGEAAGDSEFRCGLTGAALTDDDTKRICVSYKSREDCPEKNKARPH